MMNERGMTLVELVMVVLVIAVLAAASAFSYQGWQEKYAVERDVMTVFVDLQDARLRALSGTHSPEVMVIHPDRRSYTVYADKDSDGLYTAGTDTAVKGSWPHRLSEGRQFWMTPADYAVAIGGRAVLSPDSHLRVVTNADADLDCLRIEPIHLRRGWFNASRGECMERR